MKYLFVFLLISISSIVISQNRYHVDKTTFALYDTVLYLKYDMKPFNGVLYCKYGDMGIYVKGKKDGLHRTWYENGQLQSEYNYKDGKEDGLGRAWYEDGQLGAEKNYKDGKSNGLQREWYKNGRLMFEWSEINNRQNGLNTAWYSTGRLWWKGNDVNHKKEGIWKGWYENGQLHYEINFKEDERISQKCWDEDGNEIECEDW